MCWEHPDGGSAVGKCDVYITELVLVGRIEGGLERPASGFPPVDVEGALQSIPAAKYDTAQIISGIL